MAAEDTPRLNGTQTRGLTALAKEARPLGNRELKEIAGVELTGVNSKNLVAWGLVTREERRPLVHEITAAGRRVAESATTTPDDDHAPAAEVKPSAGLTPNQILALVVLMAEARQLTNKELAGLAGFAITGRDNTVLEDAGLIVTDRGKRPFAHRLTDKGWHTVRTLHTTAAPKEGKSAIQSLFALLAGVSRALQRLEIAHQDFFDRDAAPAVPVVQVEATPDVEGLIRAAYQGLTDRPGNWVGLAELRGVLGGLDRSVVDEVLLRLVRQPGVRIIPVANKKSLTDRDRDAALRIGAEDSHAIAIAAA